MRLRTLSNNRGLPVVETRSEVAPARAGFTLLELMLVMAIILTIIVVVAAGLIVATVTMLVLEKRKEIAVLKALGVPQGGIVKIFLSEGLQIGVAGGLLGLVSGLAWSKNGHLASSSA